MTRFLIKDLVKTNVSCYGKSDNWEYINYLDTGSLTNNNISEIMRLIPKMDIIPSRAKRKVKRGDILYSTVRPNQCHFGYMEKPQENMLVSTGFAVLEPKKEAVNGKYLYYYLTQKEIVNYLQSIAEGTVSTYPSVQPKDIEKINIDLPDIKIQDKIAAILSAYDDLIEKNNRKIAILQQMAEELYKEWFVRFRFPGHKTAKFEDGIPEGWVINKARDIFDIKIGRTPPRVIFEYFSEEKEGNQSWISISDMRDKVFISDTKEYLTKSALESCNMPMIAPNTVLLSFKLTVGQVVITTEETCTNEAIAHFNTKDNNLREYTYLYLRNFNYSELGNTSAIGNAINSTIVKNMDFVLPTNSILSSFKEKVGPIFDTMLLLTKQNKNLTQQRDLLLPRLMSGKLKVKA